MWRQIVSLFMLLGPFMDVNSFKVPLFANQAFKNNQLTLSSHISDDTANKIDLRRIKEGSMIEYLSPKGRKMIALVQRRRGNQIEVINNVEVKFTVFPQKITHHIAGNYRFDDLKDINVILNELTPGQVERVWEIVVGESRSHCDLEYISRLLFGGVAPLNLFASARLMDLHGAVFFKLLNDFQNTVETVSTRLYTPLPSSVVLNNLRDQAALKEFKQRYMRLSTTSTSGTGSDDLVSKEKTPALSASMDGPHLGPRGPASLGYNQALDELGARKSSTKGGKIATARAESDDDSDPTLLPPEIMTTTPGEIPSRLLEVLEGYKEGLIQVIVKSHPWTTKGQSRRPLSEQAQARARELLHTLDFAPTSKNARRILELSGMWGPHTNVEKHVMDIRDAFPAEVMDEAQYLLDNADMIPDPDERLRRDLRHIRAYSIDREGTTEVDDAVSIERLPDGREKIWMHIADVSRWIRPGSGLSVEAERRMTSIYTPDEKISMFPEALSSDLLSLGARVDSFALSCGVTLSEDGAVTSYEVCPSLVRITRRVTFTELETILSSAAATATGDVIGNSPNTSAGNRNGDGALAKDNEVEGESEGESVGGSEAPSQPFHARRQAQGSYSSRAAIGVASGGGGGGGGGGGRGDLQAAVADDLVRLSRWASVRYSYRTDQGALDRFLRQKTELILSARPDPKAGGKMGVSGFVVWSNTSSVSLVSEMMVLMSETVGTMCVAMGAPVWFKTQVASPPVTAGDLVLGPDENELLRSRRLIRRLKAAQDSKTAGYHATSGCSNYVQCTSPIRRYHDLYNHYRLKAAMHAASLGQEWAGRASEEAGICKLDSMATAAERLATLGVVRRVSRTREDYWRQQYVEKVVVASPPVVLDCVVLAAETAGAEDGVDDSEAGEEVEAEASSKWASRVYLPKEVYPPASQAAAAAAIGGGGVGVSGQEKGRGEGYAYEALALQLGSNHAYAMYSVRELVRGSKVACHLYRRATNPVTYILLPADVPVDQLPPYIVNQLASAKPAKKAIIRDRDTSAQ